jgi:hypothetical protein
MILAPSRPSHQSTRRLSLARLAAERPARAVELFLSRSRYGRFDVRRVPLPLAAPWLLVGVVTLEILVTYTRLPAYELYHVSGSGLTGGLSRALVFLNFPVALLAIGVLLLLLDRLTARERVVAVVGIALCAPIFWPGVVNQANLDARSVNVVPAVGVLLAALLTFATGARFAGGPPSPGRGIRVVIAAALLVLAVPWLVADVGLSFGGIPVLGTLYQTDELRTQPGIPLPHPAVHHGHHHGMDGTLLVLSVLLLFGLLQRVRSRSFRLAAAAYLAVMLCYGLGNLANDFWLEQVVKRGWTTWEIPDVTTPKVSFAWAFLVLGAAIVFALYAQLTEKRGPERASPA